MIFFHSSLLIPLFAVKGILNSETLGGRILTILIITVSAHILVIIIKRISRFIFRSMADKSVAKVMSMVSLLTSILVFIIYFFALGYILKNLGISLTAYVASASVIGLAVGFGSQGMVQDVVTGFTLIVSNLIDIGEMVEINGQTGIVQSIGMRFVVIRNAMDADIFFPNRNITIVINYPKGYIACIVDIKIPAGAEARSSFDTIVSNAVKAVYKRYPNIFRASPAGAKIIKTSDSKEYKRIIFKIWPGRGTPIEVTFKQELFQEIKTIDPSYGDWMISVNYEIEKVKKIPAKI
jgi:small-conductance mechanosensitive channel